ncbi:hypothetical protein MY705_03420 [Haemophilus influenzae]|uniref:hypothetical protein n=1 Tax=Haemophilus influenzae TaxID=727 RepID=UPI0010A54D0F|nr:hypothetical protein [Haemophilus influenzae]MCK8894747.1 hypothetical protein [Haemophilus influenzae]
MARNKLTRSARVLSDQVIDKYYKQKQYEVAEGMETTPSTLSRFISNEEFNQTFNFIAACQFGVFDTDTHIAIEKSEFEMLLLASQGFDKRLREKYLGK